MIEKKHTVYINGDKTDITGVEGVITYNDTEIVLKLEQSILTIQGTNLELENLSVENKTTTVKGNIQGLKYKKSAPKISFIKRLTK